MPIDPRSEETIEDTLESKLSGQIDSLTSFVATSFNRTWLDAFAEQQREFEIKLLAVQFSGWVNYAGGPITEDDLDQLDIDFDDPEAVEQFVQDSHLDQLGKLVDVERDEGSTATGTVTIETTSDTTEIPEGMTVATEPDSSGNFTAYLVDADGDGEITTDEDISVTPDDGNTSIDVTVIAEERGSEYNTGSGTVTRLIAPPPGIEGVSNTNAIDGGEDAESNDEYRDRIKNSVFESSGGGTVDGIRGYIERNVDNVNDVLLDEFTDSDPTFVDVIVDGGSDQQVRDAIDASRPAGIEHNLVRPETQNIGVDVELRGTNVDETAVRNAIEEYLFAIELGDDLYRDKLIQNIMNADSSIENIISLNLRVTSVVNEKTEYTSGTDIYDLDVGDLGFVEDEQHLYDADTDVYELAVPAIDPSSVTLTATVNGSSTTLTEGTDFDVVDDDGDGELDSIDFSIGGDAPDDQTVWEIDYGLDTEVTGEQETYFDGVDVYGLDRRFVSPQGVGIEDASGDTYELGVDFEVVDDDGDGEFDAIDFSIGGSTPDNEENFTIDYELRTGTIDTVDAVVNDTDVELKEDASSFVGDYDELDAGSDGYADQIDFTPAGDEPDDGTDFNVNYYANTTIQNDLSVTGRQKVVPDTDEIVIRTYQ